MAGILLYVAVPDVVGSLGGLAELAEPEGFLPVLAGALDHADWCSLTRSARNGTARGSRSLILPLATLAPWSLSRVAATPTRCWIGFACAGMRRATSCPSCPSSGWGCDSPMASRAFRLPNIEELNKDQERVRLLPPEGCYLVVGGPGTGKSVVALLRARRLHRASGSRGYVFLSLQPAAAGGEPGSLRGRA